MANNDSRTCPRCGSTDMCQGFKVQTVEYLGLVSPPYEQPGLWCQACGEGLISWAEMEVGANVMRQLRDQVEHLQSGQTRQNAF